MNSLPDNFLKPATDAAKRASANRPAPFSPDEYSTASIEQGSLAYVQHVENQSPQLTEHQSVKPDEISVDTRPTVVSNVPETTSNQPAGRRSRQAGTSQKQLAPPVITSDNKANIRLEIDAAIRKDMIRIKHKVGITHGVEVSYAAYFMFLHERCRAENGTATFLADLAKFTEQRKR